MEKIKDSTVKEIWQFIEAELDVNKEPYADLNATFEFQLPDEGDAVYQLHFQDGVAEVFNSSEKKADCTLKMNTKYFRRLLLGELNSTTAFMTRRISVKGNITLALKLENMLKKYQFE